MSGFVSQKGPNPSFECNLPEPSAKHVGKLAPHTLSRSHTRIFASSHLRIIASSFPKLACAESIIAMLTHPRP